MTGLEPALGADTQVEPPDPPSWRASWPVVALCATGRGRRGVGGRRLALARAQPVDEPRRAGVPAPGRAPRARAPVGLGAVRGARAQLPALVRGSHRSRLHLQVQPRLAGGADGDHARLGAAARARVRRSRSSSWARTPSRVVVLRSRAKAVAAAAVVALSPLTLIQSTTVPVVRAVRWALDARRGRVAARDHARVESPPRGRGRTRRAGVLRPPVRRAGRAHALRGLGGVDGARRSRRRGRARQDGPSVRRRRSSWCRRRTTPT